VRKPRVVLFAMKPEKYAYTPSMLAATPLAPVLGLRTAAPIACVTSNARWLPNAR